MCTKEMASTIEVEAGSAEQNFQVKTCPRCGAELFEDMDICYGCLFDFTREAGRRSDNPSFPPDLFEEDMQPRDLFPVWDEAEADPPAEPEPAVSPEPQPCAHMGSPDDTASLRVRSACKRIGVRVDTPGAATIVSVGKEGLTVGRDESCDVVLRSRAVSRRHLRIMPAVGGVYLSDLGATNPTLVAGVPLEGEREVPVGTEVDVCGANLRVTSL